MLPAKAKPLPGTSRDPDLVEEYGTPMGETDFHANALILLREALEDHFVASADVYVASNLSLLHLEGELRVHRDPDVLVAKGVARRPRRSFRIWDEPAAPCTLFEIASERTWQEDLLLKPHVYAGMGVAEYFLFDPEGAYLAPVLQGLRLSRRKITHMRPARDGSLASKELGLRLLPEGRMLRLIDANTGRPVLTRLEREEEERRRADQLAAEVERLRAQLRRLEGKNGGKG
jgi:Uma2 family endonuclease